MIQTHTSLALFITGRSGEGKTALVEHFLGPLRQNPDVAVLSGRCYDRESVPLKGLDRFLDELCNLLQSGIVAEAEAKRSQSIDQQSIDQQSMDRQ